jgi:aerobic-type carbon monoxide dehydrogenase small subunit (CoxS/CutS family)
MPTDLFVDGRPVRVADDSSSLLTVLREQLGIHSVKDGCSPQGQCGCCTVLVDGSPRVACVTPVRRIAGRSVTTVDGLDAATAERWAAAFCATGAAQCGFCSPGIVLRLVAEAASPSPDPAQALLAHLCRCTGWTPILDAFRLATATGADGTPVRIGPVDDLHGAARRAELEGHVPQRVGPQVAAGRGGFADDSAPAGALVAVSDGKGSWAVGETLAEARTAAGKVQGRRTTMAATAPVAVPDGSWDRTLQTSWVDPGYLETDASWCVPGGEPAPVAGNGGAFGGKTDSVVAAVARRLADTHGRPVRVLLSREDVVRLGPKRPPLAAGIDRAAGRIVVRVARTEGVEARLRAGVAAGLAAAAATGLAAPSPGEVDLVVEPVDLAGPPTSIAVRAAGWAEGVALAAALAGGTGPLRQPDGGLARVTVGPDGTVAAEVEPGEPLDEAVLRSYCLGAVHQGLSWVSAESLVVTADGTVADLTVRSLGILRAIDLPRVELTVRPGDGPPVAVSDAVFAATAAALWAAQGFPPSWPTRLPVR